MKDEGKRKQWRRRLMLVMVKDESMSLLAKGKGEESVIGKGQRRR